MFFISTVNRTPSNPLVSAALLLSLKRDTCEKRSISLLLIECNLDRCFVSCDYKLTEAVTKSLLPSSTYDNILDILILVQKCDVHNHNVRNANDLFVPHGRLDIRKFSIKITEANLWNSFPTFIQIHTQSNKLIVLNSLTSVRCG